MKEPFDRTKNAYLVLAHEDVAMLNILIFRLLNTGSVWIHIDKASPINIEQVIADKDVHIQKTVKVCWGGFSQVEVTRLLANAALAGGATRLTLLSGVSFPIVPDSKLIEVAQSNLDIFDAGVVDLKTTAKHFQRRFTTTHFDFHLGSGFIARAIRRVSRELCNFLPHLNPTDALSPLKLTLGSAYWSVTADTFKKGLNLLVENSKIQKYFMAIECSDESFFGTLFRSVSERHIQSGTTFVKWGRNNRPAILRVDDVIEARKQKFLFARKFKSTERNLKIE